AHWFRVGVIRDTIARRLCRDLALDAASSVGAGCVSCTFCAALSPCRAIVARMERLWHAHAPADPQFCFHTQSQLPANYWPEANSMVGWRECVGPGGCD